MQVVPVIAGVMMMDGPVGPLEVHVEAPRAMDCGVDLLVCHPHPLHGGTLDNKVVHTLARAGRDGGLRSIRFNFRGVGRSAGSHDDGVGEVDDVLAVAAQLRAASPDRRLVIAGFSFGAWAAAAAVMRLQAQSASPAALILVAPPVQYPGFADVDSFGMPVLAIQGDVDDVVDAAAVADWCCTRTPPVDLLRFPAGHFFHGMLPELKESAGRWLAATLSPVQSGQ